MQSTTGEHAIAALAPQRQVLRERQIYHVLDRTLGVIQIVFGLGTLVGVLADVFAESGGSRLIETALGIPVMLLTIFAGVLLWRGTRAGLALSVGLQLFQVFPVIIAHTAVRYVAGLQWTLRFGAPRIWKPWGFEGSFVILQDPAFPT
ncbi:MAG TPA: hypothetical protein VJ840_00575, partial [Gemmatimonadaceae bacterium]|nr:hypothetical protein [Gemmatimonadaceae bacterium]